MINLYVLVHDGINVWWLPSVFRIGQPLSYNDTFHSFRIILDKLPVEGIINTFILNFEFFADTNYILIYLMHGVEETKI